MKKIHSSAISLLVLIGLFSCKTAYQPQSVQYKDYSVSKTVSASNPLIPLLKPYSDSVNKSMNDVVAVAGMELEKKQPQGSLGNVLADAMKVKAAEKYHTKVDAAFVNYGGIRLPSIPAGNITRGKIFELAPFDNMIVLLQVKGSVLQEFLNLVANRGGWPCSGIQFEIAQKKALNIFIGSAPLSDDATYTIALVDYIANGGDDCEMLKNLPQQNLNYLFRDAVIEYFSDISKSGKTIITKNENRVRHVQ